jgi:hypothetical protein
MSEERVPKQNVWFSDLLDEAAALEDESNADPEISEGLGDDGPDWFAQCLIRGMHPFKTFMGLDDLASGMNSIRFGKLIGAKVSLSTAMSNTHAFFERLAPSQLKTISNAFGREKLEEARKVWSTFAEKFYPLFDDIRRRAVELSSRQSFLEQTEFSLGYVKGLRVMEAIREAKTKRERDWQARSHVILFAVTNWKEIEANRKSLTWTKLSDQFDRETEYKFEVTEETFKKILQRSALTIGKSSKPMSKGRSRTKPKKEYP